MKYIPYYLLALSIGANTFFYMLCDSYVQDTAAYQYAVDYLVEHAEDDQYLLDYCVEGLSDAIDKGFIQENPPPLIQGC